MNHLQRPLNALIALILCLILLSAYGVQFIWKEEPCPLCMLQRVAMLSVAIGCLLNVRCGIKMSHYALCLLSSILGGTVALRQISLHVCPSFPTFGVPVLGLSLYTWSFITFACVVFAIALLLFLYDPKVDDSPDQPIKMSNFEKSTFGLTLFITLANVITTYLQCGIGPCHD